MQLAIPKIPEKKRNRNQARTLNFLIRLNIFAIPLYIILFLNLQVVELQEIVANITMYFLRAAGFNPSISDLLISIPIRNGFWGAVITWDCTAWKSMLAFFALVMATDHKSRSKWKGLVIFIPLIFIVNLVRIFFMFFYVRTFDLQYYDVVHGIVWSWGLIITILAFWVVWMKFFGYERHGSAPEHKAILQKQIYSGLAK